MLDNLEDLLPLVRIDEFIILKQLLQDKKIDLKELIHYYDNVTIESLTHAYTNLEKKRIINNQAIDLTKVGKELYDYLQDVINYGITRYETEFGDFKGYYKLYANYYSEQITMILLNDGVLQRGTYFDKIEANDAFFFVGLKKDDEGKLNYKDKFLSPTVFQWESKKDTTTENAEGKKLLSTKVVHLFIRKMNSEDNITLPFTYFGTGRLTNMRDSFTEEKGQKNIPHYYLMSY